MRGQPLRPGTRGAGDDADVDAGTEISLGETPAEAEVARLAGGTRRIDAARTAAQPGIEHDPLAHIETPRLGSERDDLGHDLMPGHVGEGREGRHGVVDVARVEVAEHQLGVGAADAREDRLRDDPVGPSQAGLVDLVQAEGGLDQLGLEFVLGGGSDLVLGRWCPEQQCLHDAASPCACCVNDRIPSRNASMSRGLGLDHRLHVGQIELEAVTVDGIGDAAGDRLRRFLRSVVERGVVVGLVPDLRFDGARKHELDVDARPGQVDGDGLAPAGQSELRTRVGSLGGDAQSTTEARHHDDGARPTLEHPGQDGQSDGNGREVVDAHGALDLVHGEAGHVATHRDGCVVDDDVEPAVVVPDIENQGSCVGGIGEVGRPTGRGGRGRLAVGEHLVEAVGPAGDEGNRVAACRQLPGNGRADARGRAGHQDRPTVRTHTPSSCDAPSDILANG